MRRSTTTELMVEALRKVQPTVGLLSLPDVGVIHDRKALVELKIASWRTSAANYRSKLVMVPPRLVNLTRFMTMLVGRFSFQETIHTHPAPCQETFV